MASGFQSGDVEPSPLGPALEAQLRELNALRALQKVPAERRIAEQMANEQFPFDLERVVVDLVGRDLLPGIEKLIACGTSGFHTGLGVLARACVQQSVSPATAEPSVPST